VGRSFENGGRKPWRTGAGRAVALICGAAWLGVSLPHAAAAHGADANTADVRLAGDTAYVVVWPDAQVFAAFDDDRDGLIERAESHAHRQEMLALFHEHFALTDQRGRRGTMIFEDLSTPLSEAGDDSGASHLRVTLRFRWQQEPQWLTLTYSLHAADPLTVRAMRVTVSRSVADQKLLAPVELAVFDVTHSEHTLLRPPAAAPRSAASSTGAP
jgi:hypothetical protein